MEHGNSLPCSQEPPLFLILTSFTVEIHCIILRAQFVQTITRA